ncbi:MAG: reverse transcriptase domain-containing protein, partial [Candidatus Thiodiazotropha endolucinida]|nr:hypothetical protein [Candidatus Thiodiazotropha taylori]MCW4301257.1 reverse transcriptase domain-containing protein [Candidatus Thiodiazotropha endolucinida]
MLLATRLVSLSNGNGQDLQEIPVDFFPVYTDICNTTVNDYNFAFQLPHICTVSILKKSLRMKGFPGSNKLFYLYIFTVVIGNAWDVESNPGPTSRNDSSHFPCGLCHNNVGWEDRGICCDTCNVWYHIGCQGMSSAMYSLYNKSSNTNVVWECMKCGMPNFSTSLFDTSSSIDTYNHFDPLSSLSEPDSPIPDNIGPPTAASSPIVKQSKEAKPKTKKAVLNHPLRILIMNCQSIKNKKAELHTIIDSAKPDIILGNESWLTPEIKNSEIFPESFEAIRKDRVGDAHGGVFVAYKRDLLCTESPELDTDCELVWCKLNIIGCRTLYLGSFYRPPDQIDPEYLEAFNSSLSRLMSNANAQILVGGDFNCGDIEWSNMQVPFGVSKRQTQQQLLDIIKEHCLSQVVNIPTRQDKTLDLLFTNSPSPVSRVKGMPPIGKADHDIVLVEYDIKAKRIRQAPRKIFLYKRADMDGLRDHMARFKDSFLSSDLSGMSVNDMWVSFKSELTTAMERFIPTKMTKTKYSAPWIDNSIKHLIRRRNRMYFRARKSSSPDVKNHYKRFRAHVQKVIRDAYWKHVSSIFTFEDDNIDPDSPQKSVKVKKFWSFVKSLKKEAFGITSLRENGILKTDSRDKANICNKQFQSAFTRETDGELPTKGTSPFPSMGDITVDPNGVAKLLGKLKIHKASGPDGLNARVLKECSAEISPVLAYIFNESLAQGTVPDEWRQANVTPVYKKGEKYDAANYRPVSLTCICCKTLEHILVSNINKHLAFESILADCQHGFRSQRSCETQLVQFFHDIVSNLDGAINRGHKQTDLIIMDFAKAFDKVPHRRLLYKLDYYGIRGSTHKWISSWLSGRSQQVVLDSQASDPVPVLSGVPQGSVLGPVLFLVFINDLPDNIRSSVRLFADDCVLYRDIYSPSDCRILQDDLDRLAQWEADWQMKFNVAKCHSMRVSRHLQDKQIKFNYTLHQQTLEQVQSAKYLGITITDDLDWGQHISEITSKATRTLGFLRRNLAFAPRQTKDVAYKTLVRPQLEYASPIWHPYVKTQIQQVEKVQRTAARWTCRRWRNRSSVGDMLNEL